MMYSRSVVILAGGLGTRLRSVVEHQPKVLAPIDGKPFIFYLLTYLSQQGFTHIVLSVGYLKEQIIEAVGSRFLNLEITYVVERTPLGTGGALAHVMQTLQPVEDVVVLNGDSFLALDYASFLQSHTLSGAEISMALTYMPHDNRYGRVTFNAQNIATSFSEKSESQTPGFINSGVYLLKPHFFERFDLGDSFSFEHDLLCPYIDTLSIHTFKSDAYFIDIGVVSDYKKAQNELLEFKLLG